MLEGLICPRCGMPLKSENGVTRHYIVCKSLPLPVEMVEAFLTSGDSFSSFSAGFSDICGKGVIRERLRYGGGVLNGDGGESVINEVQRRARKASVASRTGQKKNVVTGTRSSNGSSPPEEEGAEFVEPCSRCRLNLLSSKVPRSKKYPRYCEWCIEEDVY